MHRVFQNLASGRRLKPQAFCASAISAAIPLLTGDMALGTSLLVSSLLSRSRKRSESKITTEASERRLRSLLRHSVDVVATVTTDGTFTMVSDACQKSWGRPPADLVGRCLCDLASPADLPRLRDATSAPSSAPFEIAMQDGHGGERNFEVHVSDLRSDPDVAALLLTFRDLTERKRYESQLAHHANHDRLTKLPNRALFFDRLTNRLKTQENDGCGFAVLFIDLDNFKVVNDSLGHEAGDALLVEVASRLLSVVRPTDTVSRLGGDEFTIILDAASGPAAAIEIAERIQVALLRPISLSEREVFVTCSIGIVMTVDSGPDAAAILRDADTAMYEAKESGKASLAVFETAMNERAIERLELETDLRVAIHEERFFLVYQPIVDIVSGRVREVEALIRWSHPKRGIVGPSAFIPLAEETGLVCEIGLWALREACSQLALWNEALAKEDRLRMTVNVSGRQFREKGFVAQVRTVLEETELDPALVEMEVTETAMLNDVVRIKGVLAELRELGLRIAIDDFGTGYSSMAYLSQLPVDTLKIDRSFVTSLGSDERADGVVQAMITMAQTLGLGITGEGVETPEQRALLQDMGCDLGQGFLFDRPLGADAITQMVLRSANAASDEVSLAA